jgi:nucleoid DNA-binding protein
MNKIELINLLSEKTCCTKSLAKEILETMINAIAGELSAGRNVSIAGFGAFETRKRAARTGRNPATGESLTIPASISPVFKPGKALRDATNHNS